MTNIMQQKFNFYNKFDGLEERYWYYVYSANTKHEPK